MRRIEKNFHNLYCYPALVSAVVHDLLPAVRGCHENCKFPRPKCFLCKSTVLSLGTATQYNLTSSTLLKIGRDSPPTEYVISTAHSLIFPIYFHIITSYPRPFLVPSPQMPQFLHPPSASLSHPSPFLFHPLWLKSSPHPSNYPCIPLSPPYISMQPLHIIFHFFTKLHCQLFQVLIFLL